MSLFADHLFGDNIAATDDVDTVCGLVDAHTLEVVVFGSCISIDFNTVYATRVEDLADLDFAYANSCVCGVATEVEEELEGADLITFEVVNPEVFALACFD